jgi:hypothetical protein
MTIDRMTATSAKLRATVPRQWWSRFSSTFSALDDSEWAITADIKKNDNSAEFKVAYRLPIIFKFYEVKFTIVREKQTGHRRSSSIMFRRSRTGTN